MDDAHYRRRGIRNISAFFGSKAVIQGNILGILHGFDCCMDADKLSDNAQGLQKHRFGVFGCGRGGSDTRRAYLGVSN